MTSSSFGDSTMGICAANRITVVASILWVRAGTKSMRPDSSSINGESSRAMSPSSCGHQAPFMRPVLRWAQSEADRRTGAFNRCHTDSLDPRWDSNNGIRMSQISRR